MSARWRTLTVYEDKAEKLLLSADEQNMLLRIGRAFGNGRFQLEVDGTLLVRHEVGYVSVPGLTLQVLPKVTNSADMACQATRLLFRLLDWTGYERVRWLREEKLQTEADFPLPELLMQWFLTELERLFMHRRHHSYMQEEAELVRIKGRLDFTKRMRQVSGLHRYPLIYDEFTQDNALNRVFKAVVKHLHRMTNLEKSHTLIRRLLLQMDEIIDIPATAMMFEGIRFDRQNESYRMLFSMTKLFFFGSGIQQQRGTQHIIAFLVPLNRVFEMAMGKVLRNCCRWWGTNADPGEEYFLEEQGPRRLLTENAFPLIPDLVLFRGTQILMILDAKYKNADKTSHADLYQIVTYAGRYHCAKLALLYPRIGSSSPGDAVCRKNRYAMNVFGRQVQLDVLEVDLFAEPIEWVEGMRSLLEADLS